jgi:hypothetical protein
LRTELLGVLLILIVAAAGGTGYFVGQSMGGTTSNTTVTNTLTMTSTVTDKLTSVSTVTLLTLVGITTSTSTEATTSCTILAPTDGVVLHVIMNNGSSPSHASPVVGAQVSGQDIGYCNGRKQILTISSVTTNSTGWASLLDGGFGGYYLTITLVSGISIVTYDLTVPTQPEAVSYATYNISTGNLTTSVHYTI